MNYDPNLTMAGNMVKQTVELTFQQWEYTATYTTTVGGNCTGLSVIRAAVSNIDEQLGGEDGVLTLKKPNGDECLCELWEHKLADMLVSARITSITPDKTS